MSCVARRVASFLVAVGCGCGDAGEAPRPCGPEDAALSLDVAGTYDYASTDGYALRGTITFEQQGALVRVTQTSYENADDRSLMGEAELAGNRLDITLVPVNGDRDYAADVAFLFGEPTPGFCVIGFSDTNGDFGGAQSYVGRLQ